MFLAYESEKIFKESVCFVNDLAEHLSLSRTNVKQKEELFIKMLSIFKIPNPSKEVYELFLNNKIIIFLFNRLLHSKNQLSMDQQKEISILLHKKIKEANDSPNKFLKLNLSKYHYTLRKFYTSGVYPNLDIKRSRAHYFINAGQPYLLTKNYYQAEDKGIDGSETAFMTREEVRITMSILCLENAHFSLHLQGNYGNDEYPLNLDKKYIEHIPSEKLPGFMVELDNILSTKKDPKNYTYSSTSSIRNEILNTYGKFGVSDFLLLRTATHIIKAHSIAMRTPFLEDAVGNTFCALEGALLLVQRKHGIKGGKLKRKELKPIFDQLMNDQGQLLDFIDEVFGWENKRAFLFHPYATAQYGWVPYLSAEDYRDYLDIAEMLVLYYLTDKVYKEYVYPLKDKK